MQKENVGTCRVGSLTHMDLEQEAEKQCAGGRDRRLQGQADSELEAGEGQNKAARLQRALLFRTCPVASKVEPGRERCWHRSVPFSLSLESRTLGGSAWGVTRAILQLLAISQSYPLLDI